MISKTDSYIPEFDTFVGQDKGKIGATDRWDGDL